MKASLETIWVMFLMWKCYKQRKKENMARNGLCLGKFKGCWMCKYFAGYDFKEEEYEFKK